LKGRTLWIENLSMDNWPDWKSFLTAYRHIALSQNLLERTLFVIPLVGNIAEDPPRPEIGFVLRRWDGVVSELDMLLFSTYLLHRRLIAAELTAILAATITQIALFDPYLALNLADEPPKYILYPLPILIRLAQERSWQKETPALWKLGTAMQVGGQERAHSALRAVNLGEDGILRRLWRAQVGILMRHIEEFRQYIAASFKGHISLPFKTSYGTIVDVSELEIGHLAYQAKTFKLPLSSEDLFLLETYREFRNNLSHLKPISPDSLLQVFS
jgi:hypothetical protein